MYCWVSDLRLFAALHYELWDTRRQLYRQWVVAFLLQFLAKLMPFSKISTKHICDLPVFEVVDHKIRHGEISLWDLQELCLLLNKEWMFLFDM